MKKTVLIILLLLVKFSLAAEPFIKINNIDASTSYPYVDLNISVLNTDNSFISGLTEDNISIYEDGYKVNYVQVKKKSDKSDFVYLVFSIDSSKSVSQPTLDKFKKASERLVAISGENEKISLYKFNDEVVILNSFNSQKNQILNNLKKIKRHGTKTLLYNSIYDSIDLLTKVNGNNKSIIIFTDGKDEGSSITIDDIVKFSREKSIALNFICLKKSKNRRVLSRLSKLSGGQLIYIDNFDNVIRGYQNIIEKIRNQYSVKYRTVLKGDGNIHNMELRFKYGSIRDRSRVKFKIPYRLFDLDQPSLFEIIIIAMFGLFFLIIVALILYILKKDRSPVIKEKVSMEDLTQSPYPETEHFVSAYPAVDEEKPDTMSKSESYEASYYKSWLVQKEGPESGKKFPIYWDEITMGRSKENGIVISDSAVSLKHAKIKKVKNALVLFDMASENGTFLNNKKLLRPKPLYDWDEIAIGKTHFIFRGSKIK